MKIKYILILFSILATFGYSQNYPQLNVRDVQFTTDSTTFNSPYINDTVTVIGVIMARTVDDYHRPILWAGSRWQTYLADTSLVPEWGGLNILLNDTTKDQYVSGIDLVDSCQVVKITGVITEYLNKQTEMLLVPTAPIEFIGSIDKRPEPILLNISDLVEGGVWKNNAEKYEDVYVEFHNAISSQRNTGAVANPFAIVDDKGNQIMVHGQSGYFTKRPYMLRTWDPPIDGTSIPMIRGVLGQNSDGSMVIRPIYPNDMVLGQAPPVISNITRNIVNVGPKTPITISAKILDIDLQGRVDNATLRYNINNGPIVSVPMVSGADSIWKAQIPGVDADSSIVSFYLTAMDNDGKISMNPVDTLRGKYFYLVLNRPLTIKDIQYSPYGSGYSGYNNYRVDVSGVVTADTSDLQGDGNTVSRRANIQDGTGPWSGLQVQGLVVDQLRRGQNVTLSGLIRELSGTTVIDSVTNVVVNSSDNPLPAAELVKTSDIATMSSGTISAEQWEGVLISYKNVIVTDDNADGNTGPLITGNNNYGEITVADTSSKISTRVELQEGNHMYHNFWDSTLVKDPSLIQIKQGDTFTQLTGILTYSFSNYKIVPRKNDDFKGYAVGIKDKDNQNVVMNYSLNQNYPNPFNPTTTIGYNLQKDGLVTVKIYNILGKEVKTLVNQIQRQGYHQVIFDARNLASGVYFYQLNVNNFITSKKMILLK